MWVVYVTSTSSSHTPVVKPDFSCAAYFDGCGRPSIQIVIGTKSAQPPMIHAVVEPVSISDSGQILSPIGPIAM